LFVNFYKSIEKQFDSDPNFYAIFYELIITARIWPFTKGYYPTILLSYIEGAAAELAYHGDEAVGRSDAELLE
jgi:hypothetical protein